MSAITTTETPIAREQRLRPRYAVIAAVCGVLLLAAIIVQGIGAPKVSEVTVALIAAHKHAGLDILGGAITTVGSLAIAATLVFLIDATRMRNPRMAPFVRITAIVGAVLAAISSLLYAVEFSHKAHQFATTGHQTYTEAHQLLSSGGLMALQLFGLLGGLLLAVSIVMTALQAMRVGLLTRFLGYVGVVAGVVVIFNVAPLLQVIEIYWFFALAVLFAGQWPSGQPPAWSSDQAIPWPSAQEMRERRLRAAGARGSGAAAGISNRSGGLGTRGARSGDPGRPATLGGWAAKLARGLAPSATVEPPAAGKGSGASARRGQGEQAAASPGGAGSRSGAKRKRKRRR